MQETSSTPYATNASEKKTLWYLSVMVFSIVLGLTILGHVMIYITQSSYSETQKQITTIDESIRAVSTDRNIVIAKIIGENTLRPSIDLKNIVTQFRLAAIRAGVQFDGFNIKEDTITTTLTASEGTSMHPDPVGLIINMMNTYAGGKEQFRLGTIKNISGDIDQRTTSIELRVNSLPIQ